MYILYCDSPLEQLKVRYGENAAFEIATQLLLATLVANPSSVPDAVHLAFMLDDDDGDLTNGTIHFREIAAAADSRHLPRPADPVTPSSLVVVSSAQFPWAPVKKVSTNSNILQAEIHLNQAAEVHISANSSARVISGSLTFRTGFLNSPGTNAMWTYSLREISLKDAEQWANFGTMFAIQLAAGTHTIYWKIWTNKEIKFSSGCLLIEAFATPDSAAKAVEEPIGILRIDESNSEITVFE